MSRTPLQMRRAPRTSPSVERDHPAEPSHLPPGELVLRMIRKPGIDRPVRLRVICEVFRQRQTVHVVLRHSHGQRLGALAAPATSRTG